MKTHVLTVLFALVLSPFAAAAVAEAYVSLRMSQESLSLAHAQAANQKKVAEMVLSGYQEVHNILHSFINFHKALGH